MAVSALTSDYGPFNPDLTIARLTMTVVGNVGDSSPLDLTAMAVKDENSDDLLSKVQNGIVWVVSISCRYDANGNGKINRKEYRNAKTDYDNGIITLPQKDEVLNAYINRTRLSC